MTQRSKFDYYNSSAIDRLTQLGTGATALVVGARQMLAAIDVHPLQLLHGPRADAARSSARETVEHVATSKRFRLARGTAADTVEQVTSSKRFKHARGSALNAAHTARDRAVSLKNSDAAKSTGKAVGLLGAQAMQSRSARKAAKKAAPLVLRRGFLVIGAGSVVFIVGRVAVRKVRQRRLDGTADEQLSSGDRNAELARRSNTAVLDVDAPMPVRPEHANGSKTSMPFPR